MVFFVNEDWSFLMRQRETEDWNICRDNFCCKLFAVFFAIQEMCSLMEWGNVSPHPTSRPPLFLGNLSTHVGVYICWETTSVFCIFSQELC